MVARKEKEWSRIIEWLAQISDVATGFRDLVCRAFFSLTHTVSLLALSRVFVREQGLIWLSRVDLGSKTAMVISLIFAL